MSTGLETRLERIERKLGITDEQMNAAINDETRSLVHSFDRRLRHLEEKIDGDRQVGMVAEAESNRPSSKPRW